MDGRILRDCLWLQDKRSHLEDLSLGFGGEGAADVTPEDEALTAGMAFHGVHYVRVAADREAVHVGGGGMPELDAGTVAMALALTSPEARLHL